MVTAITRIPRELPPWYPEWTSRAACRQIPLKRADVIFFDYGRNAQKINEAKAICATCPVIRKCYQQNREVPHGIFYGMTAIERWRERGLKGYPNKNLAYSYYAQFYGKSLNGIGPRGQRKNSKGYAIQSKPRLRRMKYDLGKILLVYCFECCSIGISSSRDMGIAHQFCKYSKLLC